MSTMPSAGRSYPESRPGHDPHSPALHTTDQLVMTDRPTRGAYLLRRGDTPYLYYREGENYHLVSDQRHLPPMSAAAFGSFLGSCDAAEPLTAAERQVVTAAEAGSVAWTDAAGAIAEARARLRALFDAHGRAPEVAQ